VEPIPFKKTVAYVNHFVIQTTQFLNRFSFLCEQRLDQVSRHLQRYVGCCCCCCWLHTNAPPPVAWRVSSRVCATPRPPYRQPPCTHCACAGGGGRTRLEITMNILEAKLNSIPEDALGPASASAAPPGTHSRSGPRDSHKPRALSHRGCSSVCSLLFLTVDYPLCGIAHTTHACAHLQQARVPARCRRRRRRREKSINSRFRRMSSTRLLTRTSIRTTPRCRRQALVRIRSRPPSVTRLCGDYSS
jgi:hypothetical protein